MSVIVIAIEAGDSRHFIESCHPFHPSILIKFAPISNNATSIRRAHLPNPEEANSQKLKARNQFMCRKTITTPLPFSIMYHFSRATIALDLVVELTPLETFSGDISRFALDLWSLSLNLETVTSAAFPAPTSR